MSINRVKTVSTFPQFKEHYENMLGELEGIYLNAKLTEDIKAVEFYSVLSKFGAIS